jgi:DNA-binding NarL/FixJ family response regulator
MGTDGPDLLVGQSGVSDVIWGGGGDNRMPGTWILNKFSGRGVYEPCCAGYPWFMAIVVAVAGAGDVVAEGLWHILGQAPDLEVMHEYSLSFPHLGVLPDVVLYDVVAVQRDGGAELATLMNAHEAAVVIVGRDLRPDLALRATSRWPAAYVSLEAPASEILTVIREAAGGEINHENSPALGGEAQLTHREVLVLGDIVKGFANAEIASRQSISHNTLKSVIRSTYRKMGVTTRAQAVSWGLQHGFEPHDEDPTQRRRAAV